MQSGGVIANLSLWYASGRMFSSHFKGTSALSSEMRHWGEIER